MVLKVMDICSKSYKILNIPNCIVRVKYECDLPILTVLLVQYNEGLSLQVRR